MGVIGDRLAQKNLRDDGKVDHGNGQQLEMLRSEVRVEKTLKLNLSANRPRLTYLGEFVCPFSLTMLVA